MCNTCSQELSHAAFYRHLHDEGGQVCPGKRQRLEDPDSTFDFGSDQSELDEDESHQSQEVQLCHDGYQSCVDNLLSQTLIATIPLHIQIENLVIVRNYGNHLMKKLIWRIKFNLIQ